MARQVGAQASAGQAGRVNKDQSKKKPIRKVLIIGCGTITVLVAAVIVGIGVWVFPGSEDRVLSAHHPFRSAKAKERYLRSYDMRAKK
jgi:threonine dehydrogenase-like Zn-dependent dehydrogenase